MMFAGGPGGCFDPLSDLLFFAIELSQNPVYIN